MFSAIEEELATHGDLKRQSFNQQEPEARRNKNANQADQNEAMCRAGRPLVEESGSARKGMDGCACVGRDPCEINARGTGKL